MASCPSRRPRRSTDRAMKVVLFCGGRGLRLREHSEAVPKPMVQIGYRPILWHVMRYYAHYGHRDFILCLGYRGDAIKDYFLHYDEAVSNDFVLTEGGRRVELLGSDIADWRITFADTGLDTTIGERLRGCATCSRRGHVPGQLRGHPHRRPARRAGRVVPGGHGDGRRSLRSVRRTTRSASSRRTVTGGSRASSAPSNPTSGSTAGTSRCARRSSTSSSPATSWSRRHSGG